ncbi:MAG TPA: hypothetical protein VI365_21355 [Trebonia sp.]
MSVEGYALVADERYSARSQGADAILSAETAAELLEAIKGDAARSFATGGMP